MFHVAHISSEEVASGILFRISDVLTNAFTKSMQLVAKRGVGGVKDEMIINFDNSATDPQFYDKVDDSIMEILYFNDSATEVVEAAGIKLDFVSKVDQPPKHSGVMAHMVRYLH